ncbi:MAG: response regulator [Polyangiaceae bacterium]|nr:response regulator [Polyangiaceae bacterium]
MAPGSAAPSVPPPVLDAQGAAEKSARVEAENRVLREQVRRLMAAENKLYVLQDHLSAQQRVYVRLADLARTISASLNIDEILATVVRFVVYTFNYERCVAFFEDSASGPRMFRVRAHEGYYDDEAARRITDVVLSGDEVELSGIRGDPGFVCHPGDDASQQRLSALLLLDEYFVFALKGKSGELAGFLVAGNTREQARYQTEVAAEGEMLVAFSNLASQTATAVAQVETYRTLERERELLDQMVADRTRELSEALDTAHEAVRVKAEFLANVSHELRTPLNSIVNVPTALAEDYAAISALQCTQCDAQFQSDGSESNGTCPDCGAGLLLRETLVCTGDPEEHYRFLKLLQQQGAHLLSLVEDVLDFSRLESGRMELIPTVVDVPCLLEEVRQTMDAATRGRERRIIYPSFDSRCSVIADRVKLKQILLNLIGNAVKFTGAHGEIRVSVDTACGDSAGVVFEVADNGIGIPEDHLDIIFESFRQVDGSHTRTAGGAGLGLAICRQLAEMHGGNISVQSRLGVGSTFRLWLPQDPAIARDEAPPPEPARSTPAHPVPRLGRGRVVVIDDEPAQLSMARKLLERDGYEVELINKPADALKAIASRPPRFVLLDIMMPEVNGLTVLAQLKREVVTREIPVLVSTAFHYNRKRVAELGGMWLPKPWSSRTLSAEHLESLLDQVEAPGQDPGASAPQRRRAKLADSVSKILYVEDEDANWEVTELSLRGKFGLTRARDSREAFERVAVEPFDLILMDIQLSGSDLNGIETCKALSGRQTDRLPDYAQGVHTACPIVMVTAYSSLYTREELLAAGARDLVVKPVDFTHLLMVISRLIVRGALSGGRD